MSNQLIELDPSIRRGYAQIGDVRLHYAECGGGDRLVILLHGFPECWYSWRHQLAALGEHHHVVAPDMRGYNLSDKPPRVDDYRIERLMDDVLGLIRHFGARDAVIVGHDWGAVVAWSVALAFPEYVRKLAALQVPPPAVWAANMSWRQALKSWYMLFFQIPALPEWAISANDFASIERTFKQTARAGTFNETDIAVYKAALNQPAALTSAVNYYRANFKQLGKRFLSLLSKRSDGQPPDVALVRVPTLFIYGEQDFAVLPQTVRGVGAYVAAPYTELRLPLSNHWVQQESHREVTAALLSFLEEG